jgi:ribosome biogenesis GTPase / thiamine phosphate phosphatase
MPLEPGLVVQEQSGFFWVEVADGTIYRCRLRGRLMEEAQSSDIAAIGDRVKITILHDDEEGDKGVIEEVEERTSVLSRAARTEGNRGAGEATREHVIIANADQAFFVVSAAQPAPEFKLLDRLLVTGEKAEIEKLVIVVNKIDLADQTHLNERFQPYSNMGYEVLFTSAVEGAGIELIREYLRDKISVLTGPSGVGKTSLLNQIEEGLGRSVRAVSRYNEEGTHTTRDSALIKLEGGGYLADTPGMRYLNIWDVEPEELDAYFIDIAPLVEHCKFGNCTHQNEPGCAVREAVKEGKIAKHRYRHYLALRSELEEQYAYS